MLKAFGTFKRVRKHGLGKPGRGSQITRSDEESYKFYQSTAENLHQSNNQIVHQRESSEDLTQFKMNSLYRRKKLTNIKLSRENMIDMEDTVTYDTPKVNSN